MLQGLNDSDPKVVGGVALTGRLGEGGSSTVYEGMLPSGVSVAVKVLHAELAASPEVRARLRREADALRAVQSGRTAGVISVDAESEQPHLVMELVRGESLDVVVGRRTLSGPMLRSLAEGIVDALDAIHRAGVVHRDLKPQNIIYGEDGVKVVDFGTSVLGEIAGATKTGSITGTPAWLSPEQALGSAVTTRTDVFNLGMVIAFAATGVHPFGEGRPDAMIFRIVHQDPDLTVLPESLRNLVAACLTKEPEARPTLAAIARALRSVGSSGGSEGDDSNSTRMDVGFLLADTARRQAKELTNDLPAPGFALGSTQRYKMTAVVRYRAQLLSAVLLLALLTVGGIGLASRSDAEGPIHVTVTDLTTGQNPWISARYIIVSSGPDTATFTLSEKFPISGVDTTPLEGIAWNIDRPLEVTYEPSFAEDETFERVYNLRELGANGLVDGWRIVIDLVVYDEFIVFSVTGPEARGVMRTRTVYEETSVVRGNERRFVTALRDEALANRKECSAEVVKRWRASLKPFMEAFSDYEAARNRTRANRDGDLANASWATWRSRWNSLTAAMSRDRARLAATREPLDFTDTALLTRIEDAHFRLELAWQSISIASFAAGAGTLGTNTLVEEWSEMEDARWELRMAVNAFNQLIHTPVKNLCNTRFPLP